MDLPSLRLTGSADVSVRPAVPADAASIARVQLVTWRTAFGDLLPTGALDTWDETAAAESWRAAIEAAPSPDHTVLVALDDGAVVGLAATAPADPGARELLVLLVEPRWGRRGHGSRLLAAVADLSRASGATTLLTWLPEQDAVTSRFLESSGWAPQGATRLLETGDDAVRQSCWHTRLDGDDPGAEHEGTP